MDKKNLVIIGLVAVLIIIGIYQFAKPSVTGNVVNSDKIIDTGKEGDLSKEVKVINEIDYEVKVVDKLTGKNLESAEVYLDGKLVGKTSSDGKLMIESLEFGKHYLRAEYKNEKSDVLTKEVTESDNNITIQIIAPRTINLELKDSETNKPIDNENVFLKSIDGKANFNPILTTDEGKAQFNDVLPGDYVISIERFPNKPADMVTISSNDLITAEVDMPNPRFTGSMVCDATKPFLQSSYLVCNVNLKNSNYERALDSTDTSVLVTVYSRENDEDFDFKIIGHQLLDFGKINVGQSTSKETTRFDEYSRFDAETKIIATVYDGWKYTPENNKQIGGNQLSQDLFDKLTTNAVNWCANNVGECVEAGTKVAGFIASGV
ncbi:hypothetical protein J4422_00385 [Candidatus Pacearchaeota archaeon]|nr:hypothetical protein [Candidatus Pacearchaeota archaeon]